MEHPVADLTDPDGARFGVTGELASGNDYRVSAAWAEAFHAAGYHGGIYYLPQYTPGQEFALALFGEFGPRPRRVEATITLVRALELLGYGTARSTIPSDAAVAVDDAAEPEDA